MLRNGGRKKGVSSMLLCRELELSKSFKLRLMYCCVILHEVPLTYAMSLPQALQDFFDMLSDPDIEGYDADTR